MSDTKYVTLSFDKNDLPKFDCARIVIKERLEFLSQILPDLNTPKYTKRLEKVLEEQIQLTGALGVLRAIEEDLEE